MNSAIPKKESVGKMIDKVLFVLFAIPLFYLVVHYFYPEGISMSLLLMFFILPILILILNRLKKYNTSKILGLLGYNFSLFLIASSESPSSGVHLHFFSCSAISIVLFNYSERRISFLFIALSTTFYIITNLFTFDLLPFRNIAPDVSSVLFIIHTVGVVLISSFAIYMVLGNNFINKKHITLSKVVIETKNEELKKTNQELDRFVYSASHDLKAPLSTILGLVNLMEMDKYQPHTEFTLMIKNQIHGMQKFIDDIVDYSRNSRVEVDMEIINLSLLINEIRHSFLHFDNSEKITLKNNVAENCQITVDKHRLQIILNNIIGNAFKYADLMKENPSIEITSHQRGNDFEIQIIDNGQGIREEYIPKLFNMFYRASETSKGSGLGLYIAMESARKMNWSIDVKSEYGKGTVFTIHIPQLAVDNFADKKIQYSNALS